MPRRDGTGNMGQGFGRGLGRGQGRGMAGRPLGSDVCTCPKCGHKEPHNQRGVPCTQIKCPKCGTLMTGEFC
ncbi:hypothetical protein DRH29_00355 [candidate division Kazan bacterium]|uniref:Ferredoxin n=1 Tax=candidate division Kazan bacterium TaxID=2202143 RepID=A0A420ZDW4_UNCK3|nr:MAG: hypothetical protein DRH29_00355 [candidate division Kazan bacterium]